MLAVVGETLAPDPAGEQRPRVYLAGHLAVRGGNGHTLGERAFPGRQGRRLFVRLAAAHEPVPAVDLADDLWGPDWPPSWEVALRALVSKLRSALAQAGVSDGIGAGGGAYRIRFPSDAWIDLEAAADGIHRAEAALAAGGHGDACGWALGARAIASRPILPGEEGEWLEALRRRLEDVQLRSLECLAQVWIATGDPAQAARDAVEAIALDPYRETAHRLLVQAHLAAGNRAAAARALAECRRLFETELGIQPSPGTLGLLDGDQSAR